MDATTYGNYFALFQATAKPVLDEAVKLLHEFYGITCDDVSVVDRDVEQGLGLVARLQSDAPKGQNAVFLELLLIDGDDRDFEEEGQVGVAMSITDASGEEFPSLGTLYNYTSRIGTSDPVELVGRITDNLVATGIASMVHDAWSEVFRAQSSADMKNAAPIAAIKYEAPSP